MRTITIKTKAIARLTIIKICALLLFLPGAMMGQDYSYPAVLAAQLHEDEVYLRWVPRDSKNWELGMENGYDVVRYTLAVNDVPLTESEQQSSKIVLGTGLKPITNAAWNNSNFENQELAQVGKSLLYSEEFDVTFTPSNFEEVVELNKTKANKFTFSLMVVDRDFELAEAFALGVKDSNIDTKAKYAYTLTYSNDSENVISSTWIDLPNAEELVQVQNVATYGSDRNIALEWDNGSVANRYSSYFIERSTDGVNFELLNETPYVYSQDIKTTNTVKKIYFKDSIPLNEVDYFYRIKGLSPFGIEGPVSEVVKGRGIPGRMDLVLTAAIESEDSDLVVVKWGGISEEQEEYVDKFEVHRSSEIYDGYVNISGESLVKYDREFYDLDPLYVGYYVVSMVDINGHYYKSRVIMAQPSDTAPPAIPSGLVASSDKSGAISLTWNANTEDDFEGYRLFRSNLRGGNFVDVANEDIYDEYFTDYLTTDMLTDSVFYAIKSSDIRGNHSDMSEIVALARPNDIPPSAAVIQNLFPSTDGIYISWVLSQSTDVVLHTLERKPKNRQGWDVVLEFDIDSELMTQAFEDDLIKYNYIDNEKLDQVVYQYRLLAADEYGNQSISNMMEVQPLFNNIDGAIYDFSGQPVCEVIGNSKLAAQISNLESATQAINTNPDNTGAILLDLLQEGTITYTQYANYINNSSSASQSLNDQIGGLNNQLTALSCKVLLNWTFKSDFEVRKVEVFRSHSNQAVDHYRDYELSEIITEEDTENMAIIDDEVELGKRYTYKILVHLVNQMTSPLSEEITILIEE